VGTEIAAVSATWRESPREADTAPTEPSRLVGPLVGVAVAGFLIWRGHVTAAAVLAVVVVGLVVARKASPRVDAAVARGLAAVGRGAGLGLSWLLLGAIMVAVIVPVWLLTHLFRWNVLEPTGAHGRWDERRLRPWQVHPERTFADERRDLDPRTRLHAAVLLLVPLGLVALVAFPLRDPALRFAGAVVPGHLFIGADEPPAATSAVPATTPGAAEQDGIPEPTGAGPEGSLQSTMVSHEDEPFAQAMFSEMFPLAFGYDPYLTVRMADVQGEYVNNAARVRASYLPPAAVDNPDALDVWFLGSSALWGIGQRDEHTIPSEVARLAEAEGIALRVHNFGVPTYRSWQDALLLAQLLTERSAPDLIVALEGYNDISNFLGAGSATQVVPHFADEVRRVLIDEGAYGQDIASDQEFIPRTTVRSPQNAADIFARGARITRAVAADFDVPLVQYLQPALWSRDQAVDDATLDNIGSDREFHASYSVGWNQARALMAVDGVIDLGDSLDDLDELIYQDDVHTNEVGARAVGAAILAHLQPTLEELSQES